MLIALSRFASWASRTLLPLGGHGLFLAAILDSSFVPLPEGVDLWLISISVLRPARMPYYVIAATLGSLIGCLILYLVTRWSEETFLEREAQNNAKRHQRIQRIQRWVDKNETLALLVGAILPPPMPFKLIVIAMGLAKARIDKFVIALLIGRTLRYAGEGLLAVHYGRRAWDWLVRSGIRVLILAVAAGIAVYVIRRLWPKKTPTHV